ncbi:hypothetical protein ACFSJU_07625 [Paradesertivirga mongoliensis]|uniref:Periplasmic heavy metal sensor n=1 Tax=Paradesertivirga mongoliensis TaxID=2100740 RepID=A0ABW4ZJM1_9SPHI|nr:hypothetical protein [Pedobacter mongoliensis]
MRRTTFLLLMLMQVSLMTVAQFNQSNQRQASESHQEVQYRFKRVFYQKRLGIDSLAAMRLVKADEEKQIEMDKLFNDVSMDIPARAQALKKLEQEHQQKFSTTLNSAQLSRLSSKAQQQKSSESVHLKYKGDSLSRRVSALQQEYRSELSAVVKNLNLDSKTKQKKIQALLDEQQLSINALYKAEQHRREQIQRLQPKGKAQKGIKQDKKL